MSSDKIVETFVNNVRENVLTRQSLGVRSLIIINKQ